MPYPDFIYFAVLLIASGVVAGLLAGLFGIGGGAILVPVFYQVYGVLGVSDSVATHVAVGTSLAIIVPTSLRSFSSHVKRGMVDFALLKRWIFAVPLGVFLAAAIASFVSGETLRLIFAVITLILAVRMLFDKPHWRLGQDIPSDPWRFIVGSIIGLLSALIGVGGGVLNNTFMTLFNRPLLQAVATSSGVGVLISLPGLIGYIIAGWGISELPPYSTGYVNWPTMLLVVPVTLLVAPLGVRLAHGISKRYLEIAFSLFLFAVAIRFFISLF